jgi:5-methylcytosine-specific restriction endonuclease McrA
MSNPRRANGHRRNQLRAQVLREEDHCWLCGDIVDKTLPPYLHGSPEVDEIVPVSQGGNPLDRGNCRLAHRLCNIRRGQQAKDALKAKRKLAPFITSRTW